LGIEFQKAAAGKIKCNISTLMKEHSVSLEPVDSKRVARYFQWCLPNLLYLIKRPDEHNTIFQWFWNSKLDHTFVCLYAVTFEDLLKDNKDQGIAALIGFAEFYLTVIFLDNAYLAARANMRDQLITLLANCPTKLFTHITQKVGMSINEEDEAFVMEWREIVDCARANRKDSLFTRITHIFVKKGERR
jgi:hypothetical protein